MLKLMLAAFLLTCCAKAHSQTCLRCPVLFADSFLYFPLQVGSLGPWHYKAVKYYGADNTPLKKSEVYNYIHNGDDLKGAEDVVTGNIQRPSWIKNFDFGEFASGTIDVGADTQGRMNGAFEWGGRLLFFKVFNHQKIGEKKYRGN